MPRNILFLSAIAALGLAPAAASAADLGMPPAGPDAGYYYGMEAEGAAVMGVEEDDSIVDIDIDLGLFDDDEPETATAVYVDAPPPPPPPGIPY